MSDKLSKLSEAMIETSFGTLKDIDIVIFVIEATSEEIGRGDMRILEKIKTLIELSSMKS